MNWFRLSLCGALSIAVCLAAGCGGPSLVPVEGKGTVKGKPADFAKGGTVTYHPDVEGGNKQAFPQLPLGTIDENGKYTISTGGKPGAPAGAYKVTVRVTAPSNPKDPYSVPVNLTDKTNAELTTTTIKKEVKAGAAAGAYDLNLDK